MPKNDESTQQHQDQDEPVHNNQSGSAFLQFEKLRAAELYYQSLQGANEKSLQYFRETISHTYLAFLSSIFLYALTYLISLVAIVTGLILVLRDLGDNDLLAGGCL